MKAPGMLAVVVLVMGTVLVRSGATQTPDKPATQVCTLKVSGMTCGGCEAAVRMAARSVDRRVIIDAMRRGPDGRSRLAR